MIIEKKEKKEQSMNKLKTIYNRLYITPVFWYGVIVFTVSYIITRLLPTLVPTETVMTTQVIADWYGLYLGLGLCVLISLLLIGNGIRYQRE
jgi:hypothetical protein